MSHQKERRITAGGRTVRVFPALHENAPIIYLHLYPDIAPTILRILRKTGAPDFTLAQFTDVDWDRDLAPWDIPPILPGGERCEGHADEYLAALEEKIVPAVEEELPAAPSWRGICGYSLGGLFSVYALYRTDLFTRAASISGSLWYPDFLEFTRTHPMAAEADRLYLSLGSRERQTRNEVLQTVQERTEELAEDMREKGIDTVFVLNPGGHTTQEADRTAAGIRWLLTGPEIEPKTEPEEEGRE